MTFLPDRTLHHLRDLLAEPDLSGTRYELLGLAGRGGMARVYRVLDTELRREVALKLLDDAVLAPDLAERLVREARIIARLEHPGIVPVYDVGKLPDGRVYYVMKLVRGRRLDDHLRTMPPLRERLALMERLCDTLAFAHAHGVIHRDLKPANVMVGAFGEVLVLDWGVAKRLTRTAEHDDAAEAVDSAGVPGSPVTWPAATHTARVGAGDFARAVTEDDDTLTDHGTVLGTPGFMAPEQAVGAIDRMDCRTDVHALGALLVVMLTGSVPASAEAWRATGVPRPLAAICRKALASEQASRYADAREMGADLRNFLSGRQVSAYREATWERALRLARRHRTALLLVLAYLAVRAALLFFPVR